MVTYLRVNYDKDVWVTRKCDPEDRWDRDDTAASWTFNHVSIVKESDPWDIVVPFEVKAGDNVYIVAAIYSTGDSFGHDDAECCEYIDAFINEYKANDCTRAIELTQKSYHDRTEKKAVWVREDDSIGKLDYVPWNGYFESLDEVRCEKLEVR
jgi:hypothetical protein